MMTQEETKTIAEDDSRVFVIPVWFMKFVSWVVGSGFVLSIGWATWMTVSIYNINTQLAVNQQQAERLLKAETEIATLRDRLNDHIANPALHSNLILRIDSLAKDIERLERAKSSGQP